MSLFQTSTVIDVVNLIKQAHRLNELEEGGAPQGTTDFECTSAQIGDIIRILAEHYEDTEFPFGSEEDVDTAMSIAYGELYVYALGGSLFAH